MSGFAEIVSKETEAAAHALVQGAGRTGHGRSSLPERKLPATLSSHLTNKLLRSPPYIEERTRAAQLLAFPLKR
jgi:hypothetical protein